MTCNNDDHIKESGLERLQRIVAEKMAKYSVKDGNVQVDDATPVDSTLCCLVFVEGKSLDPNFRENRTAHARFCLHALLRETGNGQYIQSYIQVGYEDLCIVVPTRKEAILLVVALSSALPAASDYWSESAGLSPGVNSFAREYPLKQNGEPDLDRPGPVNFIDETGGHK